MIRSNTRSVAAQVVAITFTIIAVIRPLTSLADPGVAQLLPAEDTWEGNATSGALQGCAEVDSVFFSPVRPELQEEATGLLLAAPFVPIAGQDASRFLQFSKSGNAPAVQDLIATAISKLEEQRRNNFFSRADQARLDQLIALQQSQGLSSLVPYLVRAVGSELATTGFRLFMCGDVLLTASYITPNPYQRSIRRLPVVVFLQRAPMRVHVERYFPGNYQY